MGAVFNDENLSETATAARISQSGITAQLVTASSNISRALTGAIRLCAQAVGYQYDDISYQLPTDLIDVVYSAQDKTADLQLVESGRMPVKSYFEKLKRVGELSESMTFDEYLEEIEEDANRRDLGALPQITQVQPGQLNNE